MFDMTKPIQIEVVIGAIAFILVLVAIGLGIVEYYKKKYKS